MAEVIRMPKMSDTMEQGILAAWLKKEGDTIKEGDILAEVETDKATMDLEAYADGTLLYLGAKERDAVPINSIIAVIGEPGEDITALLQAEAQVPSAPDTPTQATLEAPPSTSSTQPTVQPSSDITTPIVASPLAKKMAQAHGYDLATIKGTGPNGRIVKRDIEALVSRTAPQQTSNNIIPPPTITGQEAHQDTPISAMRRTIAQRLSESVRNAPHFSLTVQVNMDQLVAARPGINVYAPTKVSFNDLIIKAAAMALRSNLAVNVAWLGDSIRHYQHIHIGVAMAVEDGLLVPVVRFADQKSLPHIAAEVQSLTKKAREQQLKPQDWEGGTFTISNLGMMGVESFTPIINPPAACILAIGEIKQVPIVRAGVVVPGHVMSATLSCDHRAIDGALGATFLQSFKALLEDPVSMLAG